jgi:Flp pilus assembly protein TadD
VSSLLDILHKREDSPDRAPAPVPADDPASGPIELRLAVDNGPLEPPESVAPTGDPFSTTALHSAPSPPPAEGTQVLHATQFVRVKPRNTTRLGIGLGLILAAALIATRLVSNLDAGDESAFVTIPPETTVVTPEVVAAPAAPTSEASAIVRKAPAATPAVPVAEPDWYDAPAVETGTAVPSAADVRFERDTTVNPLFPILSEAYAAFQSGDFARSEQLYRQVQTREAGNIDALLGLAALAARGERPEEARNIYREVLRLEPKNTSALSALSLLPAANGGADESALKNLIREQPAAANLHFALGLWYLRNNRWPDAQIAFFEAVRFEPTNADYAYNLAVSLDRLGQAGPAQAYYRRALELSGGATLFVRADVEARLAELAAAP